MSAVVVVRARPCLVCVALLGVAMSPAGRARVERLRDRVGAVLAASPEEAYVRGTMMPQLRRALDPSEPVVRNTAVQIAARREGTFRVEQVAALPEDPRSAGAADRADLPAAARPGSA